MGHRDLTRSEDIAPNGESSCIPERCVQCEACINSMQYLLCPRCLWPRHRRRKRWERNDRCSHVEAGKYSFDYSGLLPTDVLCRQSIRFGWLGRQDYTFLFSEAYIVRNFASGKIDEPHDSSKIQQPLGGYSQTVRMPKILIQLRGNTGCSNCLGHLLLPFGHLLQVRRFEVMRGN